jgi:hypothetical protein
VVPDDENSALVVSRAVALLPPRWSVDLADEHYANRPPQMRLPAEDAAWLADEVCQRQDALLEARRLADLPKGRHPITFTRDFISTLMEPQQRSRAVLLLLYLDVMLEAENGDMKVALHSCRALLNGARSLGDEPTLISQLIRMAGVAIACQAVQRVVAQGEPDPAELAELQKLLENEEQFPRLVVGARGERGGIHQLLDALESGDVPFAALTGSRTARDGLTAFVARDNVRAQHPDFLALISEMVRIAALPPQERDAPLRVWESKVWSRPRGSFATLFLPAMAKMHDADRRTDGNLRCTMTALAAERYRHRHGRFPDSLDQLVPHFLPAVLLDPKDGQPLGYQHLPDRIVIYSLCRGPSKSGTPAIYDPDEPSPPGEGVAFHVFEVQHRRQPPPELVPMPAIAIEAP